MGTQGATIVPLGCPWHPSIPLLELCWERTSHSRSATLLLWGDLCRPFGFHIGSLEHAGSSAGRHQRSPGARSVPIWCGQVASPQKSTFLEKVLPQAAKLPATSGVFKKNLFLRKSSAPGSEAARDKWLVQKKKSYFEKKICPRQLRRLGQVACSQKNIFFYNYKLRTNSPPSGFQP